MVSELDGGCSKIRNLPATIQEMRMQPIKFGTDGWRAIIAEGFTVENLNRVTEGMADWLRVSFAKPSVMVGYDCRFHGQFFSDQVARVLASLGIQVFVAQRFVSTPMVSLAVSKRQASAGIVITASHNPPEYSGFKIKGEFGGPALPGIVAEIEHRIPDVAGTYPLTISELEGLGWIRHFDMEALYLNHLRENFDLALIRHSGLRIGYDAMYGAGQRVFRKLLPDATMLHAEYNPSFHGTAPEPIEKNLLEFQALIRSKGLDYGLATDGDADRIGLFDEQGHFVDSHHIILLLIHYLHKVKGLTGKVVHTFSVTPKVGKMARLYGLPVECTKVGFKYICEIMLHESVLIGGEESGGIAVAGHVPERDGIYIGLMILEMMARSGKKLTELVQEVEEIVGPFSFQRRDLHLPETEKHAIVERLKGGNFGEFGPYQVLRTHDLDGYKFDFADEQWVMVRPSGTEPVLRVYAESTTRAGAEAILDATVATIRRG
jgi:phosphomannomutase